MRTPDYKLQTPETKKHSEEHWYKSNVSEAGEGTAPLNEESKPTTENTETKQVLRVMEKFWFEEPPFHTRRSQGQCSTQIQHSYWCKS
jgi:hypothetical protein